MLMADGWPAVRLNTICPVHDWNSLLMACLGGLLNQDGLFHLLLILELRLLYKKMMFSKFGILSWLPG